MKNIFYILFVINILFTQTEYQILSLPHNAFRLSTNNGSHNLNSIYSERFNYDSTYSFSSITYPENITLYNSHIKNVSLSILDYGQFENKIDDIVLNIFHAYEISLIYNKHKNINELTKYGLSIGGVYSSIHNYHSAGIFSTMALKRKIKNAEIGVSIENAGLVLKPYTDYKMNLPLQYRLSLLYFINQIQASYDIIYSKYQNELQHIINLSLPVSNNISLILGNTSNSNTLSIENYDFNFLSGLSCGLNLNLNKINLDIGIKNLGPAGLVFGLTLNFLSI